MNFNAQHSPPSRILGSHLLEKEKKKLTGNAVLFSQLLHSMMLRCVCLLCVVVVGPESPRMYESSLHGARVGV